MIFKDDHQKPLFIPTPGYDDLFPKMSIQRVIDNFVNGLDLKDIEDTYEVGGAPPYHPRALLKVVLYGYARNIYGCRPIADMCKTDMVCQWYTNFKNPSFSTINRFRSIHMGLERTLGVFSQLVEILVADGLVSFEECTYIDGTTIESRASRTKLVWAQSQRRFAESNKAKIRELLATASAAQSKDSDEEDDDPAGAEARDGAKSQPSDPEARQGEADKPEGEEPQCEQGSRKRDRSAHMSPEELAKIKGDLAAGNIKLTPGRQKELEERLERAERYRERDELCGEKSGTALTDPDSIAMHPKEDVRRAGPCLPMYNLQLQTQHQFILSLGLFGTASDMAAFPLFLSIIPEGQRSKSMAADAGYGCYENYMLARDAGIDPIFKYSTYDKECGPNYKADPFKAENLVDQGDGTLKCPGGELKKIDERTQEKNGVAFTEITYYTDQCAACEFRHKCHGNHPKDSRKVKHKKEWHEIKPEIKEMLDSQKGQAELRERSKDVEPTFAHTKWAGAYDRFRHFGAGRCRMDLLIRAMAHNLKKYISKLKKAVSLHPGGGGAHSPKPVKLQKGRIPSVSSPYGRFSRNFIAFMHFLTNQSMPGKTVFSASA